MVQFRNLDYAMENCVLNISLPVETARFHPDINLTPTSVIDVWTLEDSAELAQDIRGGTAARAPARRTLLATLPFPTSGSQQSGIFRCPSGAFTTLELACAPRAATCYVDFWQDRRAKPVGGEFSPYNVFGHTVLTRTRRAHHSVFHSRGVWEYLVLTSTISFRARSRLRHTIGA